MEDTKDFLYIFFHIPKTAGSTFRHHVEHNFKKGETLSICHGEFFDAASGSYDYFSSREKIDAYLSNLTDSEKEEIKVLHGHRVYYGIHKHFRKKPRYITFVRHPASRLASSYSYTRDHVEDVSKQRLIDKRDAESENVLDSFRDDITHEGKMLSFEEWLTKRKGKMLSFEEWLTKRKWHKNFMTTSLLKYGFINTGETAEDALRKFYFVGITENYSVDGLFMYHLLNIKTFYPDQNVSKKYFSQKHLSSQLRYIFHRNSQDFELYDQAKRENRAFKDKTPGFYFIVQYMKWKIYISSIRNSPLYERAVARCVSFVKSLAHVLYRISGLLKRHFPRYARMVHRIKSALSLY